MKNDAYFNWLVSVLPGRKVFSMLYEFLYNISFKVILPRDNNRCEEAKGLRSEYFLECNCNVDMDLPANVLEVLLIIARRCDDMVDSNIGYQGWFSRFLKYLELVSFNNDNMYMITTSGYYSSKHDKYFERDEPIVSIIHNWMNRTYNYNGVGGIFPLKNPKEDQRKVELWYQMAQYIDENYEL